MKKLLLILILTHFPFLVNAQQWSSGADISWCTEMEADSVKFYNNAGIETDLLALMQEIGMTAVRLRVWVNPENGYGRWSDKADVLTKAKRAHEHGLDIMLDFHYSDNFADPGKQAKPDAWKNLSFDELKQAVATHTIDVLQAVKDAGIEVKWVQVGNETTSGMLWNDGHIDWDKPDKERYLNYIALSNAGYEAVKKVMPETYVIIHHDKAQIDNTWYYKAMRRYGAKFDMIGLSLYPDWDKWEEDNTKAARYISKMHKAFGVPVMLVEAGYPSWDEERAEKVMADLLQKMKKAKGCTGVFYWEPQVYGGWGCRLLQEDGTWSEGHKCTFSLKAPSSGAFTPYGQPAPALLLFGK
ncbi:MAG: glycosyl hydrolase 53 family protein [Paludibacteraceae bacterium]|nr:glycosyl hydrolase 53 family protein [Paludibacteraceae bacterium]